MVGDRGVLEERLGGADQSRVRGEEDDGRDDDGRDVGSLEIVAVGEVGPAHGLEREAREHPRDRELSEVEDDAVERPAANEVGHERGDHLHGDDLGDAVTEEQREGERRGEGLLSDLAVDLDREQLADQDERGEHPELAVGGAEVAGPEQREPGDDGDACGAYQPQVDGEGGLRAANGYSLRGAPSASSRTSSPASATAER